MRTSDSQKDAFKYSTLLLGYFHENLISINVALRMDVFTR